MRRLFGCAHVAVGCLHAAARLSAAAAPAARHTCYKSLSTSLLTLPTALPPCVPQQQHIQQQQQQQQQAAAGAAPLAAATGLVAPPPPAGLGGPAVNARNKWVERPKAPMAARAYLRLGIWQWALRENLDEPTIGTVGVGCCAGRTVAVQWTAPVPLDAESWFGCRAGRAAVCCRGNELRHDPVVCCCHAFALRYWWMAAGRLPLPRCLN